MTGLGPQFEIQDQLRRLRRATKLRQAEIVTTSPVTIKLGGSDVVLEDVLVLNGGDLDVGDVVPVLAADGNILVLGSYATGALDAASPAGGGVWAFSSSTTMADPGDTFVRFNNATLSSATRIAIHERDASDINRSAWVRILDSPLGQNLSFSKLGGTTGVFKVTGTVTTTGSWHEIPVEWLSGVPTPAADDYLLVNSTGLQAASSLTANVRAGPVVPVVGAVASTVVGTTPYYETMAVWVDNPGTFSGVGYWSGAAASGSMRAALYSADNTVKVADRTTNYTASGANTFQFIAFDADVSLNVPGLYWIMLTHGGATNTRLSGTGMMAYAAGTVGSIPTPATMSAIPTTPALDTPPVLLVAT